MSDTPAILHKCCTDTACAHRAVEVPRQSMSPPTNPVTEAPALGQQGRSPVMTFAHASMLAPLLGVLLASDASAAVYYVSSATGNDGWSGTSESSPWQSLAKINGMALAPGDAVYLKRGDVF